MDVQRAGLHANGRIACDRCAVDRDGAGLGQIHRCFHRGQNRPRINIDDRVGTVGTIALNGSAIGIDIAVYVEDGV